MMNRNSIISDEQLWYNFISGEKKAFDIIYEEYIQVLQKYGCHFSKNEELIKDCIQDLFIDLLHYRSKLKKTDNIKAYLIVSLRRKIKNVTLKEDRIKSLEIGDLNFDYSLSTNDSDNLNEENRIQLMNKAMNELTSREREAIYLKYVVGLSYEELSETLQLNYQTSRNLIYRGIKRLRSSLIDKSLLLWLTLFRRKANIC